jgi:hypothetical protein
MLRTANISNVPTRCCPGQRKDRLARILMHHVKADHCDIPHTLGHGTPQHFVLGVVRCGLGDAEVTEFAFGFFLQQGRCDDVARVVVGSRCHAVQLVDVDIVGGEPAQRVVERGDSTCGTRVRVADIERRFGRNHDLFARHPLERLAEHRFGTVGGGRVEQVDPEVECLMDQRHGLGLAFASAEPEPTEPTAAQPRDTDPNSGSAEYPVLHAPSGTNGSKKLAKSRPPNLLARPAAVAKSAKLGHTGGQQRCRGTEDVLRH